MTQVILYTSEDGRSQIQLRAERGTVRLSQLEMAELFQTSKQNIAKHLKAIFADQELGEEAVVSHWLTTAADPHFGLLTWKGAQVRKQDIVVAKNYLSQDEIDTLNRLVAIFLETAELRAKRQTLTPMAFWQENVEQIITANGFPLLSGAGSVSHARMEQKVGTLFQDYDQRRKTQEAQAADAQDEAELKAVESKIKHRTKPS